MNGKCLCIRSGLAGSQGLSTAKAKVIGIVFLIDLAVQHPRLMLASISEPRYESS